jgi:hypothetical protein
MARGKVSEHGIEVDYGDKDVVREAFSKKNAPGVSATAAKGNIRRAHGGKVGSDHSPFSSAHYAYGGSVHHGSKKK